MPNRNVTVKKLLPGFTENGEENAFGYTITDTQTVTVADGTEVELPMSDGTVIRILIHPQD